MNPQELALSNHDRGDAIAFAFAAFFAALIIVPPVVFGLARRIAREQPQFGGAAIGGAVAISLGAIGGAGFLLLVLLGWLPPVTWNGSGG